MRRFIHLVLILVLTHFSVSMAHAVCSSDKALKEAQFKVHSSSDFTDLSHGVLKAFMSSRHNFVFDTDGPMRAKHPDHGYKMYKLISFDDVTTPHSVRYGDVMFVYSVEPTKDIAQGNIRKVSSDTLDHSYIFNQIVEVRWWDEDHRHVVYDNDLIDCAVNVIPMAENALF